MSRHAVVFAVVLCLGPSFISGASAQNTEFTVNLASANVHKAPSTGSPVIGTAPRGAVLEVTRHLGDWVKVTWTAVPDSIGYMHLSGGSVAPRGTSTSKRSPAPTPRPTAAPTRASSSARPAEPLMPRIASPGTEAVATHEHAARPESVYVTTPTHIIGLGGQVSGSTLGFGGNGRFWTRKGLGVQFEVSRYAQTNAALPGRMTSVRFAPSVLYSLPDRVTDYFWVRPYVGGGVNLHRQTFSDPAAGGPVSDGTRGYQAFGGGEITLPSAPRFALSADVGYRWGKATFPGFDIGGLGFAVSGHWYVR
jgi:hypothetical protein